VLLGTTQKNSGKILEQKRLDFLDILLEAEDAETGAKLDDIEIREEVDTFMVCNYCHESIL